MYFIAIKLVAGMKFSDDQVRKMAALRDDLYAQIRKYGEKIEMLEGNVKTLDMILKESSFTRASALAADHTAEQAPEQKPIPVADPGGKVMAKAYVTPEQISIILEQGVEIDDETPPFRSFFIDRIIGEMKKKDTVEADAGKIQKESIIDCAVTKNGSHIEEIVIKNYRQSQRVNEIISTVGWSLTRMLENVGK